MASNTSKWLKKFSVVLILLLLLVLVFCLYFLKYVPEQRANFHRNAFLELSNIESAVIRKDNAYRTVAQGKIDSQLYYLEATIIGQDASSGSWQFQYFADSIKHKASRSRNIANENPNIIDSAAQSILSKGVDTFMTNIVAIYKDIFDGCLLIRTQGDFEKNGNSSSNKGKIIYHSGDLSVDENISFDSVANGKEELGLPGLIDARIEGNNFKLFLHPFHIGDTRLIVAGVIRQSNYNSSTKKIPFSLIAIAGILVLLLLIHLPILKIYLLGAGERIRDIDMRLIIGSYFVAAFVGFFLFSQAFLDNQADIQNEKKLSDLSDKISEQLSHEINCMVDQLKVFDQTYSQADSAKREFLKAPTTSKIGKEDSIVDKTFMPRIYPYLESVIWLNRNGSWVGRWMFRKSYRKAGTINDKAGTKDKKAGAKNKKAGTKNASDKFYINVSDRIYFKDFINNKAINLPGKVSEPFTIQPTLSKLDGEFVVTVVIKSHQCKDENDTIHPFLIAMGSQMYSVSHVVLPPGFGFSIVDQDGTVNFDSKTGRPLLSNIYKEMPNPAPISQTIKFRTSKFFSGLNLRGKDVALLSKPLAGFPFQLLVYYNLSRTNSYAYHVIGISAFLTSCVLILLMLTAMINQWSKNKFVMLQSKSLHFDWLHPSDIKLKKHYYAFLVKSMLLLFAVYLFAWIVIETFLVKCEISLLLLSLLFPFYVALLYYYLRQQFYFTNQMIMGRARWWFSNTTIHLRMVLIFIIVLLNCFACFSNFSWAKAFIFVLVQIAWILLISKLISYYGRKKESIDPHLLVNTRADIPMAYVYAIIVGVILISIIPASGIFWVLHRQETSLNADDDQLATARLIDQRSALIDRRLLDYKTFPQDEKWLEANKELKYILGIYIPGGRAIFEHEPYTSTNPVRPASEYVSAHNDFFEEDTMVQALSKDPYSSEDSTWNFRHTSGDHSLRLAYRFRPDITHIDSFQLEPDSSFDRNAASLITHEMASGSALYSLLYYGLLVFSFVLAVYLTRSLGRKVFLFALQKEVRLVHPGKTIAEVLYETFVSRIKLNEFMVEACNEKKISPSIRSKVETKLIFANFLTLRDIYMIEKNLSLGFVEAGVIEMVEIMRPMYEAIWKKLTDHERFLLYDFALDGFSNYRNTKELFGLINKGVLFFDDLRLSSMTMSFQEFVLEKRDEKDIRDYIQKAESESTLKKFKGPLLVGLAAVGIFLFVTQDTIYQKIMGLLTSSGSLISFLSDMLKKNGKPDS